MLLEAMISKTSPKCDCLDEEYDLVIVGVWFAGCGAAYYYLRDHPNAKVLICDNHEVFGGEARHNEFEVDGYKLGHLKDQRERPGHSRKPRTSACMVLFGKS